MNILLSGFPTKINGCNINTDFRVMIQYEKIIRNDKISEEQKIKKILDLFSKTRNNQEFVDNAKKIRFY